MNTPVLPMDGPCHVGWWNISVNGGGEDSWCKSMAHEFHIHTMNNVNSWPRSFFRNWGHRGGSNCKRSNISYKPPLQLYVRCITFAIRRNINIPSFGHAILHRNVHVIWHWVINIVVACRSSSNLWPANATFDFFRSLACMPMQLKTINIF